MKNIPYIGKLITIRTFFKVMFAGSAAISFFFFIAFIFELLGGSQRTVEAAAYAAFSGLIAAALFLLIKIMKSIIEERPFTEDNVRYFNIISKLTFCGAAINYIERLDADSGLRLLNLNKYIQFTPDTLFVLLLACIAWVMGVIFKMAADIKKENDLTI
ncbi:MAG: DUF2975 domain-containing protein [Bacillota bacterium]